MGLIGNKISKWIDFLRGSDIVSDLKRFQPLLKTINERDEEFSSFSDDQLKNKAAFLRESAEPTNADQDWILEGFALVREASKRAVGMRPYDVQVLAGLALFDGGIVQMQTGEGKTLAAVAPAFLHALLGHGVHVLTFNDYLARRDAKWMGPVYEFLGLSVGFIQEGMNAAARKQGYGCDITYATAKEAGFDYLRDQLADTPENIVQRPFHFAIVDEADSLMIDEARVPLVIAGSQEDHPEDPVRLAAYCEQLKPGVDFETDDHGRNVFLTRTGQSRVQALLGSGDLYAQENGGLLAAINVALHARALLVRDVDYIVRNDKIELVDEFTGRVAQNRKWPDGLQTALEAKEKVVMQKEGVVLGSLALQHFFGLYPKLSGMTATASPAAEEFMESYRIRTYVIPPNRPCIRIDQKDLVFATKEEKDEAVVREVIEVNKSGRPVLVGTQSVAESERIAARLVEHGVSCQVLNAKNDEQEAKIVAKAGSLGAVTISTNMAGRGTDIRLGTESEEHRQKILFAGGLLVIGTNRHESRRIDDQLKGRAGRQGDPGESRFYLSLEDELFMLYGLKEMIPEKIANPETGALFESETYAEEIKRAQRILEGENLSIRKMQRHYSELIEKQRLFLKNKRDEFLFGELTESYLDGTALDLADELKSRVGVAALSKAVRQVAIAHIDRGWADYLMTVADIREGIYLVGMGGGNLFGGNKSPVEEFHHRVVQVFEQMIFELDEKILGTLQSITITEDGADLESAGLGAPASTWTYLVSDNPFGNELNRFFAGMKKRVTNLISKD